MKIYMVSLLHRATITNHSMKIYMVSLLRRATIKKYGQQAQFIAHTFHSILTTLLTSNETLIQTMASVVQAVISSFVQEKFSSDFQHFSITSVINSVAVD